MNKMFPFVFKKTQLTMLSLGNGTAYPVGWEALFIFI